MGKKLFFGPFEFSSIFQELVNMVLGAVYRVSRDGILENGYLKK